MFNDDALFKKLLLTSLTIPDENGAYTGNNVCSEAADYIRLLENALNRLLSDSDCPNCLLLLRDYFKEQ